ncbi:hypothetical protein GGR54DRAFT_168162 [Hypoxylon sp. NC1633]|nr:hypothetical protein GGR54DRAFT_168162 [Hypoxylon sp. NC1633]
MMYNFDTSESKKWDPEAVLGLFNCSTHSITCIGHARTQGRQCQRTIAQGTIRYALDVLRGLSSAYQAAKSPELLEVADTLLCWQHRNQSSEIHSQWRRKLRDAESSSATSSEQGPGTWNSQNYNIKKETSEDLEDLTEKELRRLIRRLEKETARVQAELQRRNWYYGKPEIAIWNVVPGAASPLFETDSRPFAKQEQARRQKEEQKRQEEERERQEEEQKRQEEKRRKEACREQMRLAREKQEREEKAKKEASEWHATWNGYFDKWNESSNLSVANIPWPVKSGLESDVTEASVKLFFERALPEDVVASGAERYKLINAENKKWHTDKIMQRFGPDAVTGTAKIALDIIAKVLIELRQEAQKKR